MFKQINTYGYISTLQEDLHRHGYTESYREVCIKPHKYKYRENFVVNDGDYVLMNILYSEFAQSYPCKARVNC